MALTGLGYEEPELCKAQADALIGGPLEFSLIQPGGPSLFLLNVPNRSHHFRMAEKRGTGRIR